MVTLQLAWKNTIGAGIRTWLNVIVLSVAFVTIIGMQGLYTGMLDRARDAMIRMELGAGQFWHSEYDPYDPFALTESHGPIPTNLQNDVARGDAVPILITQGSIFPEGRIKPILLKGIPPEQTILEMPTKSMVAENDIPALIGNNMAENSGLSVGDYITVRWRDANGTYDAADVRIAHIMETIVQSVDNGQIWLPLDRIYTMTGMEDEATLIVRGEGAANITAAGNWIFRDIGFLTREIDEIQDMSDSSLSIMYFFLLGMGLLAVFDTQVLSLWRRRKEMGTLMALGMTRGTLIRLFTLEGALHAILAILVGAVWGLPLLTWFARTGFTMPEYVEDYGMALGRTMYPTYGAGLVMGTIILVFITVTIVSYLPTRKIAKLEPTDALRGKFS
ncbi:MAG: FtsX-like permease family protein [Candidatus Marinimicrobia bacterium]|nr:FtsX-like permease family protein [Candidatus Neomarinimicrobiota bacterium]MCF7830313.1 FtsX-like permease family protein [Candidatus Neomarinimicrobiota bacterium]MCF7882290.1 FtsX-like permease family protein [Candidatus Neomarinimicrobiota bacterium]